MADGRGRAQIIVDVIAGPQNSQRVAGWLNEIQKQTDQASKTTAEHAVAWAKKETQAKEIEAKRQQQIVKESLEYAVARVKAASAENARTEQKNAKEVEAIRKAAAKSELDVAKAELKALETAEKAYYTQKKAEQKKATADFINATKEQTSGTSSIFSSLGGFSGGLAGGLAGGAIFSELKNGLTDVINLTETATTKLFEMAKSASETAGSYGSFQVKTGLAADSVSALAYAANLSHKELSDLQRPLIMFSKYLGDAADDADKAAVASKKFGITDFNDLDKSLGQVFEKIEAIPPGVQQMNAVAEIFGRRGGLEMLGVIHKMHGEFDTFKQKAQELGVTLSQDDIEAAKKFNRVYSTVMLQATMMANKFALAYGDEITDAMSRVSLWLANNQDAFKKWGQTTGLVIDGVIGYWDDLTAALNRYADQRRQQEIEPGSLPPGFATGYNFQPGHSPFSSLLQRGQRYKDSQPLSAVSWGDIGTGFVESTQGKKTGGVDGEDPADTGSNSKAGKAKEHVLSPQAKSIIAHALALGLSPLDYATLLEFEGAGSLSTSHFGGGVQGRADFNTYLGPAQFSKDNQRSYGIKSGMPFDKYLDQVNKYFVDRKVPYGGNLAEMYAAINPGGEKFLEPMLRIAGPKAKKLLEGYSDDGASAGQDAKRLLEQQSDRLTKDAKDQIIDHLIEIYQRFGFIPDDKMLGSFQQRLAEINRGQGVAQPTEAETRSVFESAHADRLAKLPDLESPTTDVSRSVYTRPLPLMPDEEAFKKLKDSFDIEQREDVLLTRKINLQKEYGLVLKNQELSNREHLVDLDVEYQTILKMNTAQASQIAREEERNQLTRETKDIEIQIGNVRANDGLRQQLKELQAILTVEQSRLDLSHAMETSTNQVRAGIYEHMAQQQTESQAIAEGWNKTYDAINNLVNGPLDKLDQKTKGFLSFLIEPLKAMQTQRLNTIWSGIVDKIFPGDSPVKDALKSSGNPVLDEARKQTTFLKEIAANTSGRQIPGGYRAPSSGNPFSSFMPSIFGGGSGMGPGGTPYFNPNSGGGTPLGSSSGYMQDGQAIPERGPITGLPGGTGGKGGIFDSIKGMFSPRKNVISGKDSKLGGILGGAGDVMSMVGGMIGGKWGGVLGMAGQGMSLGSMFGPWGAAIGGGIGALIGLLHRDNAIKKLREAALSTYGITVKDKSVLDSLKMLGETAFGKGQVGAHALEVVRLDDAVQILTNYATTSGQHSSQLENMHHTDASWSGNNFTQFGGFRASGGPVAAGRAYVVGERRAELFIPSTNGTISPSLPSMSQTDGRFQQLMERHAVILGQVEETMHQFATRLEGMDSADVIRLGASDAREAIGDAMEERLHSNPRATENFARQTGQYK